MKTRSAAACRRLTRRSRARMRGATLVEYLLVVGTIALVALLGFRGFGHALTASAEREGACIGTLSRCSDGAAGSATSAGSTSIAVGTASGAQNAHQGAGYWIGHTAYGIVAPLGEGAWNLTKIAFSAQPLGAAYYHYRGLPNPAWQTVKGLGRLALLTAPGVPELSLWSGMHGGPDPFGDMVRGIRDHVKHEWQRDPAETLGRGIFEVGSFALPFLKAKSVMTASELANFAKASNIAKASEVSSAASEVAQSAELLQAAKEVETAAAGARVAETGADAMKTAERVVETVEGRWRNDCIGTCAAAAVDNYDRFRKLGWKARIIGIEQQTWGGEYIEPHAIVEVEVPGVGTRYADTGVLRESLDDVFREHGYFRPEYRYRTRTETLKRTPDEVLLMMRSRGMKR